MIRGGLGRKAETPSERGIAFLTRTRHFPGLRSRSVNEANPMSELRRSYPSATVYHAVLRLRRLGHRVESYCRDRRLHVIDNAIVDERELLWAARRDAIAPSDLERA